jgi:hypothetical protein
MRVSILLVIAVFSSVIVVPSFAADDQGGCASNFSVSGNFLSGKGYKTTVTLPKVNSRIAFKRAYASLTKNGYQIVQSDKEIGSISASQQVTAPDGGKTAPFNALVESASGSGSQIVFTYSTSGGLWASEDSIRDEFCKITSDVLAQSH